MRSSLGIHHVLSRAESLVARRYAERDSDSCVVEGERPEVERGDESTLALEAGMDSERERLQTRTKEGKGTRYNQKNQ